MGIAAKVAQKISVLFEDDDLNSSSNQKKTQHHSGWPAAHDAALSLKSRRHDFKSLVIGPSPTSSRT